MTTVRCDLVIPVYNALRSTRDCLDSVRRNAPPWTRVVVVNDGSDRRTTEWLRAREEIVLLENPVNLGFVKTANRGLVFSDAPYVCLLNSDTLVTEGALERMVARMDADRSIALCCPISNGAVNLSVRIPPGEDVFSFGRRVARTAPALYPDATTIVGFCLLFRREVVAALGVFDEVFGRGYCEETDYHYRCRAAGWRCVVADDAFVYHRHEGSFTDRDARFEANLKILMARWRIPHERELAEFDARNALGAVRDDAYEWRLPDPAPEASEVLFVLSSLVAPAAAAAVPLADALVLGGSRVSVAVLDESAPADAETFFRALVVPPARLGDALPAARAVVATDDVTAAALALAGVRAVRPDLPLSGEPELFYPRDGKPAGGARVAARAAFAPEGGDVEVVSFDGLARDRRAALFGTSHVVVDLSRESALTALEAMCAGAVPVLARGSTGERVVTDGATGLVLPDESAARQAALALARDAARRERLSAAAMAQARARSWDDAARDFLRDLPGAAAVSTPSEPERAALARLVDARPRPERPAPRTPPGRPRTGLRARLGRLRRRLLGAAAPPR